jgi:hypothetical protein
LIDWRVAALVIAGGVAESLLGARTTAALAGHKRALAVTLATIVMAAGFYVTAGGLVALLGPA